MSSHAAAAISAMISSQASHPPATVRRRINVREEPEAVRIFTKRTNETVGILQMLFGCGIFVVSLWILFAERSIASTVMSMAGSTLYIASGVFSCARWNCMARVKSRLIVVRATIVTSALSGVTAIICIVIYFCYLNCVGFSACSEMHVMLVILCVLSFLELAFAALTIVYAYKALYNINDLEPVVFSREGWRDGTRGSDDGKDLMVTSAVSL
ncbi:uncharacterized protein LOC118796385 isoform X1 [Megalops cyprinoides]|uniref:uncharacterized protein LOC118796385 isoform X1 n=2 Tax=Megalops cyprinoides TaxID=118141 RepID=UPI001863DFD9|nr:uncharacterized protein LOC118796385 isoform X1 [Megalops cyprinoides]